MSANAAQIFPVDASEEALIFSFIYVASKMPEANQPIQRVLIERSFDRYWKSWGRAGDLGFKYLDPTTQLPVGCVWLRVFSKSEAGDSFVRESIPELTIGVLEQARKKGIGKLLMQALIKEAKTREFEAISLSVREDNQAIPLYESLGFRKLVDSVRVDQKGIFAYNMIFNLT